MKMLYSFLRGRNCMMIITAEYFVLLKQLLLLSIPLIPLHWAFTQKESDLFQVVLLILAGGLFFYPSFELLPFPGIPGWMYAAGCIALLTITHLMRNEPLVHPFMQAVSGTMITMTLFYLHHQPINISYWYWGMLVGGFYLLSRMIPLTELLFKGAVVGSVLSAAIVGKAALHNEHGIKSVISTVRPLSAYLWSQSSYQVYLCALGVVVLLCAQHYLFQRGMTMQQRLEIAASRKELGYGAFIIGLVFMVIYILHTLKMPFFATFFPVYGRTIYFLLAITGIAKGLFFYVVDIALPLSLSFLFLDWEGFLVILELAVTALLFLYVPGGDGYVISFASMALGFMSLYGFADELLVPARSIITEPREFMVEEEEELEIRIKDKRKK